MTVLNIIDLRGKLPTHKSKRYGTRKLTDIRSIAIHHSLTFTGSAEAFAEYHVRSNGWPGIGYAYVVGQDGKVYKCWDPTITSYHVGNSNKHAIGICMVGDFRKKPPTPEQYAATVSLVRSLRESLPNAVNVKGHNEYPGYAWKSCPVIDMDKFRADVESKPVVTYKPQVIKERIYAAFGKLRRCDGDYSKQATDVRWVKFETGRVRCRFVSEPGAKVSELRKKYDADYAFNFPYFHGNRPLGDTQDNDRVISSAYGKMLKWHEFAAIEGVPMIGQLNPNDKQDFLVQGAPLLISKGNPAWSYYRRNDEVNDDIGFSPAQRTFIGVDANGDLIVAVADGRTKWDKGLTLEEMSLFMQSKGAVMALNGDGGGSSVLADRSGVLNQNRTNERTVHHAVLVYLQ